jgi:hypothetical protein
LVFEIPCLHAGVLKFRKQRVEVVLVGVVYLDTDIFAIDDKKPRPVGGSEVRHEIARAALMGCVDHIQNGVQAEWLGVRPGDR